jgi:hypothetical protein
MHVMMLVGLLAVASAQEDAPAATASILDRLATRRPPRP